jgi:CRP-like cAMP-binding protein
MIFGLLKRGDFFGEHSSLDNAPNPYSIEALTQKVEVYKIHRSNFFKYFGG